MKADRLSLKTLGSYLVVLLVIVRFVILPLHNRLAEKKLLLAERQELLTSKQSQLRKQAAEKVSPRAAVDREALAQLFYPKDSADTVIQADLIKSLIDTAEKKSLTVVSFEMPEVAREKELSEVGAVLRLRGQPAGLLEMLRAIDHWPKKLRIKSLESARSAADFNINLTVVAYRIER